MVLPLEPTGVPGVYAGTGREGVRATTRGEYRRLLVNFALTYIDREVRVRELAAVQHFVDWLTTRPGRVDGSRAAVPVAHGR
jgi:hypothetical protein